MSLINDALKKARATQPRHWALGASGVGRPVMRPLPARRGKGMSFLMPVIAVVLLLAGGLLWAWYRAGHGEMVARAKTETGAAVTTSIAPKATAVSATTAATPEASRAPVEKPKVEPVAPVATADPAAPPTVARRQIVTTQTEAAPGPVHKAIVHSNANTPKPPPHDYKLQGIFYSPKGPSAVIDGELVSVGSDVADGKVVAIDNESATVLTTAGETNVLVLAR